MHSRLTELFNYLDQEYADLLTTVAAAPKDRLNRHPAPGRWSIAQILEHLVIVERRATELAVKLADKAVAGGIPKETETGPILMAIDTRRITDRSRRVKAPEVFLPPGKLSPDESLNALDEAHRQFKLAAAKGDGLALREISYPHPWLGSLNAYEWIAFVAAHMARHTEQIREVSVQLKQDA